MARLSISESVRSLSQPVLLPVVKLFASLGIHPNLISVLCFSGFLTGAYFIAKGEFITGAFILLFSAPLDAVDGALARYSNKVTRFGAFLDSTLDRYGEIALFLGFLWYYLKTDNPEGVLLSFLATTGSLMVSYTRARAEGAGFECKVGLLTRFERLLLLIVSLFFNFCFFALILISIFTYFTAFHRMWHVYKQYKT
jgi:CDP-diacylglycerol--glycerol-3-phosphate 3-phosphatidyltransferase